MPNQLANDHYSRKFRTEEVGADVGSSEHLENLLDTIFEASWDNFCKTEDTL